MSAPSSWIFQTAGSGTGQNATQPLGALVGISAAPWWVACSEIANQTIKIQQGFWWIITAMATCYFQLVWVLLVICDDQTHRFFGLDILAEECNKRSGSIQAVLVVFLEWIAPKRRREQLKFWKLPRILRRVMPCQGVVSTGRNEANALTRAAADASAPTLDVLTVSDQWGQLASQPATSREAFARRLAGLKVAEGKEVNASLKWSLPMAQKPRATSQDLTLPIASPSPRDTEVMQSNEVQLNDVAVNDLVPADSVPWGIMITGCGDQREDSCTRTADSRSTWLVSQVFSVCQKKTRGGTLLQFYPLLKDLVEEATWSAQFEEI